MPSPHWRHSRHLGHLAAMQVSEHAIRRYCERVAPIGEKAAHAAMMAHEPAVTIAAQFGCGTVKLGNGVRLKLKGDVVTTVFGNGKRPGGAGDGRGPSFPAFGKGGVPSPADRPLPGGERKEEDWR